MAQPTAGNPSGGYDMAALRAAIEDARKRGADSKALANELWDHPVLGPKMQAAKKRGESADAALALVTGDYATYGRLTDKGENSPVEKGGTTIALPGVGAVTVNLPNLAAGAGKSMVETARGITQFVGSPFVDQATRDQWGKDQVEADRLDAPLMNTTGGSVGKIGTDIITTAIPGAGATTGVLKAIPKGTGVLARGARAVTAAATGGAATEPFMARDESLNSLGDYMAALGMGAGAGVVGDVVARGAGRVIKPLRFNIDPDHAARIQKLESVGMNQNTPRNNGMGEFDLAQLTQDPTLIDLKSSLAKLPGFSSRVKMHADAQLGDATEALTARSGYPSRSAGPTWAGETDQAFSDRRNVFKNGPPTALDRQYLAELRGQKGTLSGPLGLVDTPKDIFGDIDAGIRAARGGRTVMSADDALAARSVLSKRAHGFYQSKSDPMGTVRGEIAESAQDALDSAIKRGFDAGSPGMGDAFDTYRRQMREFLDLTDAAGRPGGLLDGSFINPKALLTTERGKGRGALATGRNEMGSLAEAMDRVLLQQTPNSGTPQRSLYSWLLMQGPTALTHAAEQGKLAGLPARLLGGPALGMHMLYGSGPLGKKHMLEGAFGPQSDKLIEELLRYSPGMANTLLSE